MPVLHLLAGPNGSGKTTFYEQVLGPVTGLPFINADVIARERWPDSKVDRSYEAAKLAEQRRDELIAQQRSFIAETVFSHDRGLLSSDRRGECRSRGFPCERFEKCCGYRPMAVTVRPRHIALEWSRSDDGDLTTSADA